VLASVTIPLSEPDLTKFPGLGNKIIIIIYFSLYIGVHKNIKVPIQAVFTKYR
jgi:hypothetical protein